MRIKINFKVNRGRKLPIEYNYELHMLIKNTLFEFLKKNKPKVWKRYNREFPDFTFSQLMIPNRALEYGFIIINSDYMSLLISSYSKEFIEYLFQAFNFKKEVKIFDYDFYVKNVEIVSFPEIQDKMRFKMLSPSVFIKRIGNKIRFIKPFDPELNESFQMSIKRKLEINNLQHDNLRIKMYVDQEYAERNRVLTKLINVNGINYRAIYTPIIIEGDVELIGFCYESGIGFNTELGFGMLGV